MYLSLVLRCHCSTFKPWYLDTVLPQTIAKLINLPKHLNTQTPVDFNYANTLILFIPLPEFSWLMKLPLDYIYLESIVRNTLSYTTSYLYLFLRLGTSDFNSYLYLSLRPWSIQLFQKILLPIIMNWIYEPCLLQPRYNTFIKVIICSGFLCHDT